MNSSGDSKAARFVGAVGEVLEPSVKLQARAGALLREANGDVDAACRAITSRQSNVSAATGGLAMSSGLVPGIGTAAAVYGVMFGQMVDVMKVETELCLMQASVFGFDIELPRERKLAMLLAAVVAFEVQVGSEAALAAGVGTVEAIGTYSTREADNILARAIRQLLLVNTAKRGAAALLLSVPLVGVGVGVCMNKVLTHRVGTRAQAVLKHRRAVAQ